MAGIPPGGADPARLLKQLEMARGLARDVLAEHGPAGIERLAGVFSAAGKGQGLTAMDAMVGMCVTLADICFRTPDWAHTATFLHALLDELLDRVAAGRGAGETMQ